MKFPAKVDSFFIKFIVSAITIISLVYLYPLYRDYAAGSLTTQTTVIILVLLFLSVGFLLWVIFFIQYVFYDEYLLVKGGPIRSRIQYEDITKVNPSDNIYTGYRILSAKIGLEIFYKTGAFGSVKISPKDEKQFLSELMKRSPQAKIHQKLQ